MSLNNTRGTIEKYFYDNWAETEAQFDGQTIDNTSLDDFIALKFVPVANNQYAFDGTSNGRVEILAEMQVFCYAKNVPKVYILADKAIAFLSGLKLGTDINVEYGQAFSSALDLNTGWFELQLSFTIKNYT